MSKLRLGLAVLLTAASAYSPAFGQTVDGAAPEATVSSPYTSFDPIGDATLQKGDITAFQIVHRTDVVKLAIRLRLGTDLSTWRSQLVSGDAYTLFARGVSWRIDVDGDSEYEYQLWGDARGAHFGSWFGTESACRVLFLRYDPNLYVMGFRRSCIGNPSSIRAYVEMSWYTNDFRSDHRSYDRAPPAYCSCTGWSPRVAP